MRKQVTCWAVCALTIFSCQRREQVKCDLLIKDVQIVDVESGKILPRKNIVVTGQRIVRIDSIGSAIDYEVAQTFEASGKYIMPGLWDMHAHPDDPEVWRMDPQPEKRDLLLPLFVVNGVMGIRDMAGSLDVVKTWREKYRSRELLVPKIYAGGPLLDGPDPMWDGSVGIDSPEQVKHVVDSLIVEGVDFLKVYSLLPCDIYFQLSQYANEIGFPFVGHVPFTVSPSEAAMTGMKSQEHLLEILKECSDRPSGEFMEGIRKMKNGIDRSNAMNAHRLSTFDEVRADSLYSLFVQEKIWHCPTLSMWRKNAWYEEELSKDKALLAFLPQYLQAYWTPEVNDHLTHRDNEEFIETKKKLYSLYLQMVKRMHEKGVILLAGTDMGANPLCFPGVGVHNELEDFVQAGLSPAEALRTATINPALFFGIKADYGTVEVGKIANLVLLDNDPLGNIQNIRAIDAVVYDGVLIDATGIEKIKKNIQDAHKGTLDR